MEDTRASECVVSRVSSTNDVRPHFAVAIALGSNLGDREAKDIAGPHAVGARGILVPIAKDRGGPNSKADAVCRDFRERVLRASGEGYDLGSRSGSGKRNSFIASCCDVR